MGECDGTPSEAVIELPSPINEWGQIACTLYGHIISNKEGWVWSNVGGYSPVMIPSQMVRSNPKALGNAPYFTKIAFKQLHGVEAESAINVFEKGFDKSPATPNVYSMSVTSVSGKELALQFFEFENDHWGMWCKKVCNPDTKFMILNMTKKTNQGVDLDSVKNTPLELH